MTITEEMNNAKKLMYYGNLKEALNIVERLEKVKELTSEDRLACHLLKSKILIRSKNIEQAINILQDVLQESERLGNQLFVLDAFILNAHAFEQLNRLNDSLKTIEKGEQRLKTMAQLRGQLLNKQFTMEVLEIIIYFLLSQLTQMGLRGLEHIWTLLVMISLSF